MSEDETNRTTVPFETALSQLEAIVAEMEDGSLGLEESMTRFEDGVKLLRACYQQLERAEQKIELLVGFDEKGQPEFTPFDATSTIDKSRNAESADG